MSPLNMSMRSRDGRTNLSVVAWIALASIGSVLIGCASSSPALQAEVYGNPVEKGSAVSRDVAEDLTRAAESAMKRSGITGMAMSVVADDGSSWSAGFGAAGKDRNVTPETPFWLASVTKFFTAVAVMTLVEEGAVDLDAPIGDYVPEMSDVAYPGSPSPTVRNLLTHHSGTVSDLLKGNLYDGPTESYGEAFMDLVPIIAEQPLTESPRMLAHYSNVGYTLLGALITNVSGVPFTEYVTKRILEPLQIVIESKSGSTVKPMRGYQFGSMAGRLLEPEELAGTYASEIGAIVVSGKPRAPKLTLMGMKLSMVPREQGSYGLQIRLLGFIPIPIADVARIRLMFREINGRQAVAYYEGGKLLAVALKVEPQPVPAAWEARYGRYQAANPDSDPFFSGAELGFNEELGFMTITVGVSSIPEPVVLPLIAVDDTTLVSAGHGRRLGETYKAVTYNGEEAIRWAGLILIRE